MMKKMCILHSCWFHVSSASSPFAQSFVWLGLLRLHLIASSPKPISFSKLFLFFPTPLASCLIPQHPSFLSIFICEKFALGHSPEPPHLASEKPAGTAGLPGEDNSCRLPEEILTNSVFCQDDALVRILRSRVCHERKGKYKRTQVNEDIARWKMNCREINHGRMLQFSLYLV